MKITIIQKDEQAPPSLPLERGFPNDTMLCGRIDGLGIDRLTTDNIEKIVAIMNFEYLNYYIWNNHGYEAVLGFDLIFCPMPDGLLQKRCNWIFAPCVFGSPKHSGLPCPVCFGLYGEGRIVDESLRNWNSG